MARPKSQEKKMHLLLAAAEAVAERGIGAPTALIAKRAGVAEGTLFCYFATKEVLLNELYLYLCRELNASTSRAVDPHLPWEQRMRALWNSYIEWGVTHQVWSRAMNQLSVTEILTDETRQEEALLYPDPELMETILHNKIFAGLPHSFGNSIVVSIADTTVVYAAADPAKAEEYKASGFKAFWGILNG
jgi:AcrR family transcriptional regulator